LLAAWLTCGSITCLTNSYASDNPAEVVPDENSIVFAASNDSALPLAEFHGGQLTSGILKDLGDAIAAELHRKAKYVVVPRKRLDRMLTSGAVDGVCYYRPEWVAATLNWGPALIPNDILLVAGTGVPKPKMLEEVAGMHIGVVLGYKYPELDALHGNYQREEAPSMPSNIRKLIAGRMNYAVIDSLSLRYEEKSHPEILTFSTLSITKINASCGFSLTSKIPFNEIEVAIGKVIHAGTVDRILAQYR
jgi:ABC-type amino acid transport substrate-binding protein